MPRRVVLMRHATAHGRAPTDAERPLSPAGHAEAERMGSALMARGIRPTRIVASPARRAAETAAAVARAVDATAPTTEARLYEAEADDVLRVLEAATSPGDITMIVGHNPSMADAVMTLSGSPTEWEGAAGFFPPASAAVLDLPQAGPFAEGSAVRLWLLRPNEL